MDYLNALPVEIWREIFLLIAPFSISLNNGHEYLSPILGSIPFYSLLQRAQSNRIRLLTICKSLYPLIHTLLFTEVVLKGVERIDNFVENILFQKAQDIETSELTKTLYIYSDPLVEKAIIRADRTFLRRPEVKMVPNNSVLWQSGSRSLPSLFSLCPNVGYLYMDWRTWFLLPRRLSLTDCILKNVRILTLRPNTMILEPISALPTVMPHLQHLDIIVEKSGLRGEEGIITILSVKSASLSLPARPFGNIKIQLPSLLRLSVAVDNMAALLDYIRFYPTLVELELNTREPWAILSLPVELFTICKRLEKFTFNLGLINAPKEFHTNINIQPNVDVNANTLSHPHQCSINPHPGLRTLILFMSSPEQHDRLVKNAAYFSKGRFPSLSLVVSRFNRVLTKGSLEIFKERMVELFEGVETRIEVLN